MSQLSSVLAGCAKDVFGFFIMFFIVFIAYAQLGYLVFGATTPDYKSMGDTMFTLARIILGDFDFPTLEQNNPSLGPLYFFSYVFFVFFVLLNMFLAIINDTYSEVKSDTSNSDSDLDLGAYFKQGYDNVLKKLKLKKEEIVDIQNILDMADDKGKIDFEKWRNELRKRGYSDIEIEAHFAKYDKDGDRNLTIDEQKAMRVDLNKQMNELNQEMDDINNEKNGVSEEDMEKNEIERKKNLVTPEEFKILTMRVDTMENSIGNIVTRIDTVLNNLETIERAKLKRREAMAKILDKLNEANNLQDDSKRNQLQKMVKEELEKWDEPGSATPTGLSSRAVSPRTYTPAGDYGRKSAWRQQ